MVRSLASKLEDLNTCNDLIAKHGSALQKTLSELEQVDEAADAAGKLKAVNERATLFRITSNAMINVSLLPSSSLFFLLFFFFFLPWWVCCFMCRVCAYVYVCRSVYVVCVLW